MLSKFRCGSLTAIFVRTRALFAAAFAVALVALGLVPTVRADDPAIVPADLGFTAGDIVTAVAAAAGVAIAAALGFYVILFAVNMAKSWLSKSRNG